MKKLKLSELNLGNEAEVLTREQLKKVLGGANSGGTTVPQTTGGSDNGCPDSQKKCPSASCTGKCTSPDGTTTVEVSGSCGWTGTTSTCTCGYAC